MPENSLDLLRDGPGDAQTAIVLAHGAGAGRSSPFMVALAGGLAARDLAVYRFDFPYMQEMAATGRRRPPNPAHVLEQHWQAVISHLDGQRLVIGGKSLGGRIASLVADRCGVAGLVCLGYPFHPPGRPEKTRTAHLAALKTPTLICQGTHDPFGPPTDVGAYNLSDAIRVHWLEDGDHSFVPRRATGRTAAENWAEAIDCVADFVRHLR